MKKIFTLFITVILMSGFVAKAETVTFRIMDWDDEVVAENITGELTVSEDGVWTITDFLNSGAPLSFTLTPDTSGKWENMVFTNETTYLFEGDDYPYFYNFKDSQYPICKITPIGGTEPTINIYYTYLYTGGYCYVSPSDIDGYNKYGGIYLAGSDSDSENAKAVYYYVEFYFNDGAPAAIADVTVDENAPVEYFNLQGVRVDNPTNGLYIRRQGKASTKVLIP